MLQLVAKKISPPGGRRVTHAEVERRLAHAEKMLRDGHPRSALVAAMRERFGMSTRAVDDYIARVRTRWTLDREASRATDEAQTEARLSALSRKLEAKGAWSQLVKVERLLAEVRGLRRRPAEARQPFRQAPPEMSPEEAKASLRQFRDIVEAMDLEEHLAAGGALPNGYEPIRSGLPAASPPVGLLAEAAERFDDGGVPEHEDARRTRSALAMAAVERRRIALGGA